MPIVGHDPDELFRRLIREENWRGYAFKPQQEAESIVLALSERPTASGDGAQPRNNATRGVSLVGCLRRQNQNIEGCQAQRSPDGAADEVRVFLINLKTAKTQGVTIPPHLLPLASEVTESGGANTVTGGYYDSLKWHLAGRHIERGRETHLVTCCLSSRPHAEIVNTVAGNRV
jgi:hypothetical protein